MSEDKTNKKLQKSNFERFGLSMKRWGVILTGLAALVGGATTLAVKGAGAWHEIHSKPVANATTSSPSSPLTVAAPSSSASFYVPPASLSTSLPSGRSDPAGCSQAITAINTYLAVANAAGENNNLPALANAFQEMHAALASDQSLAGNTNVEVAIYELATDANNIAYEVRNDELTAASGALTRFKTDVASLDSVCNL